MVLLNNSFTESISTFFLATGWLEWCGVFTGILCVWLAAKNNIWNWPIAIISVAIYIYIFSMAKLYADAGLQVYFLAMNIYGWYYWSIHKDDSTRPIAFLKPKEWLFATVGVVAFTALLGTLLFKHTDASFPFIDSFCTACSLVAQILLARKVLQNWLIWIFVDIIYVYVYFSKELYATGLMYALYVYIALMGYLAWRKIYREQSN